MWTHIEIERTNTCIASHAGERADGADSHRRRRHPGSRLEREPYDLVIVDVFMPGMDGYQAIKEFQRLDPGIPIIAMSGVMFRESSQRHAPDFLGMAAKLGATRTLNKPFKPAELMEAVEACGEARAQQFDMRTRNVAG
jgi:CheY-like chemotaxis protein